MLSILKDRLPKFQEIMPVYAVVVFLIYGWSLALFLWKIPSWLMYLHAGEIFTLLSYTILTDLLESLLFMGGLIGACLLLPARWVRSYFVMGGATVAFCVIVSMMLYQFQYGQLRAEFNDALRVWGVVTLALALLLVALFSRLRLLGSLVSKLADRLIVFLYILMPLSVAAVLNILIRNLR